MSEPGQAGVGDAPGTDRGLRTEDDGMVRVLTIDRPDRLNSLSRGLWDALCDAFLDARMDPDVRVVVLTGAGDRAFCPGADLKEVNAGAADARALRGPLDENRRLVFEVMLETYKPIIAALNGATIGGGLELALASDIRLAASGIQMGMPEARRGLGAFFASVVLPRRVPPNIALEWMFTGELFDSEEAARWGLVNRVVPREELLPQTMEMAQSIAANAPLTVRRMKEAAMKGMELPISAAIRLDVGPNVFQAEDRLEGVAAFLEKREPQWKGR